MNGDYKIPKLNEGLVINEGAAVSGSGNMMRILQNINKPMNEAVETKEPTKVTCPECGMTFTPETPMEDGSAPICPGCDHVCNPAASPAEGVVEDEDTIEERKLEESLAQYVECLNNGDTAGAKSILESVEAEAICESAEDGVDIMLEKFVIKVDSSGKKIKKKVRTKKMRRTAAQKAALRKARKTANKGAAKKKRKKAMKARARMGLTESLRKSRTMNAVQKLAESAGFSLDSKALEKAINEAYDLNEAEVMLPDENVLTMLETVLRNKGIEVLEAETEIVDGVIVAHLEVSDTDAEVFLGDVADEVAESLQGYDVDYDEPEDDSEEDNVVFIDFYFVPTLANESCNYKKKMKESEDCDDPEGTKDPEDKKVNESVDIFESCGGTDNVRCKLHPGFIKAGQVIYDADDQTVFTALTESVSVNGEYSLAVEIMNSANPELASLASGAEISLGGTGKYFLLKNNPVK